MKNLLMDVLGLGVIIALVIPAVAVAQPSFAVDKGSNLISGTANFTNMSGDLYEDWDENSFSMFALDPSIVHFVSTNFAIGVDLSLIHISQGDDSATAIGGGPKLLYAFGTQESSAYPYISAGFNYMHTSNGTDVNGTTFKFGAGVFVMPAGQQHLGVAIEAGVNLDSQKPDYEGAKSVSGTQILIGVGLVGFIF